MSTVLTRRRPIGRDYAAYFASPYAVARTLILSIGEFVSERRAQALQRRRDVHPRIHRGRAYALVRAWATVVQRDLQVAAIVGDMMAGRPVVYTTFLAYDEVAHHSGVERPDTLEVLRHVDRQLARVMASGCLGLISFPREPGRVTLQRVERMHPRLLPALRAHPGIGFVLVRSERDGAVALGEDGIHYLDQGRVEGEDPLAPFGPHAADHVRRTDSYPHCPDLVLNSSYWADADEVAAFEELVGSHGGMGGGQSFPFVLFPAEFDWPEGDVIGSERVHRIFRGWLAALGQDAYADTDVDSPGMSTRTSTEGATASN